MRRGYVRLWFSFLLCLMLAVPAGPAEESPDPAPNVRVLLQRLNLTDRADLSLLGDYQVSWGSDSRMLLPSGSEISVQVRKGSLILFYRDASLDCGPSLLFARQASGKAEMPGLKIAPGDGLYPGDLRLTVSGGMLQPVLTLSVEDYLLGVVPYEMSEDFPLEALKAQAVCARTYALSRMDSSKAWDLVDTTNDQVFRPILSSRTRTAQAVQETAGLAGFSGRHLAVCYYGASNGGQTELPSHVWSGAKDSACYAMTDDPYDLENPESIRKKALLRRDGAGLPEAFGDLLREAVFAQPEMKDFAPLPEAFRVEEIRSVSLSQPRYASPSRLMTKLEITLSVSGRKYLPIATPEPDLNYEPDDGEASASPEPAPTPVPALKLGDFEPAGTFSLSLDLFPNALQALNLSIYGANNEIVTAEETPEGFLLSSGRYGHGVGMSQRGAQWMASRYGKTFLEILEFYYPGITLKKAASGSPVLPTPDPVLAETPGPAATPTPRPTLMPVTADSLPEGAWLASVEGIEDDSTLNLRAEPSSAGEILMRLYKHQRLIVLETCEDPVWVHVRTDSAEGYVMVSFLERVEGT